MWTFMGGALDGDAAAGVPVVTLESLQAQLVEMMEASHSAVSFLQVNDPKLPTLANQAGGISINTAMLAMLSEINKRGGCISDVGSAAKLLVETTTLCIETQVPPAWETLGQLLDVARQHGFDKPLQELGGPVARLLELGFGKALVRCIRWRLILHVCCSLGQQQYMQQDGPVLTPKPYLPPLARDVVSEALDVFNISKSGVDQIRHTLLELQDAPTSTSAKHLHCST